LPSIDSDPQKALAEAYTTAHRRCFPAPVIPEEYQSAVDLGSLAVAGPYACYIERSPEGGYQWDLRRLARYEHHDGLRSCGMRTLFRVNEPARKLEAVQIDCELGSCKPGDSNWELATKIALCAVTTHLSLVRHFNWVHLAAGGPFAIATRNCLSANHPLRRLLWPHLFGTQYSNQIVTKGQMAKGGDFETIFSFTHAGMCKLFEESYEEYDITVLHPARDGEIRGISNAGFDTPALFNREAHSMSCVRTPGTIWASITPLIPSFVKMRVLSRGRTRWVG
jgi:arachidonate 15-lipoxygenase